MLDQQLNEDRAVACKITRVILAYSTSEADELSTVTDVLVRTEPNGTLPRML